MNLPSINDTERTLPNSFDSTCYRFRRHVLYVCLWGIPFFIAVGIGSACMAFFSKSCLYPKTLAAFFILFWSFWTLLGIFGLFQYVRSRLILGEIHVESVGVFKRKLMALNEVTQVVWRTKPAGGSIVLCTSGQKIVIELYNYDKDQRNELINFFREKMNHEIQVGWDIFSKRLFGLSVIQPFGSRLFYIVTAVILLGFGVLFINVWMVVFSKIYLLIIGIFNLIASLVSLCLAIRSKHRKKEMSTT
jgi:hypothetical protein